MKRLLFPFLFASFIALSAAPSHAQGPSLPGLAPIAASTVTVSTGPLYIPLPLDRGPWVIGQVVFSGNNSVADFSLRGNIRARRGMLYTPSDIASDIAALTEMPSVLTTKAEIFALPNKPIPATYKTIAVSTMMVRIVYTVEEKEILLPGLGRKMEDGAPDLKPGQVPVAQSAVVMTPTAYRSINQYNRPGMGLDVNAVYFIGRLYGKNSLSTSRTNFIDRIGIWFLSADGKMQLQSEGRWRPAMSVGARGFLTFRDAPQPSVSTPGVSIKVSNDSTRALSDGYLVFSKKIYKIRSSLGFSQGNAGDRIGLLSEFMAPNFLPFAGHPNTEAKSKSVLFASLLYMPKPDLPIGVEILKPNGMVLNPMLINFKIGYFLKMNFDVAYLRFDGGWDLLGMFQFRYVHFPRTIQAGRIKKKK